MRYWCISIGTGLVKDPQFIAFHDQGVAAALVIGIQHASVDLDDAATKALQNFACRRRCVPDHNPVRADRVKRRL